MYARSSALKLECAHEVDDNHGHKVLGETIAGQEEKTWGQAGGLGGGGFNSPTRLCLKDWEAGSYRQTDTFSGAASSGNSSPLCHALLPRFGQPIFIFCGPCSAAPPSTGVNSRLQLEHEQPNSKLWGRPGATTAAATTACFFGGGVPAGAMTMEEALASSMVLWQAIWCRGADVRS